MLGLQVGASATRLPRRWPLQSRRPVKAAWVHYGSLSWLHMLIITEMQVGVGCSSAKEVATAIQKAVRDAKKNLVRVNITKDLSFPHFYEHYEHSAKIMLRPAAEGTGKHLICNVHSTCLRVLATC